MAEISAITPLTLTSKGLKLQAKVQAGLCKLNFVKAVIGYGYLTEETSISSMTQLIHEIPSRQTGESGDEPTVDMTLLYADEQTAQTTIRIHIQNGNNPHTYAREIGFITDDPTEGHILYGVANLGDEAPSLPAYNGVAHVSCNIDIPIAITNAKDVTVNFTLAAGVQHEEFEAHKSNTDSPHTIEFTEAETLLNITSGERLSLIFGKIKKAIASLISHLADESNPHNVTVEQIGAIPISAKGSAGGVAELDASGTVPSSQLPSYVDDVIECNGIAAFPTTGESGKIYVDTVTNLSYRWSGSQYTEISKSLAIGETSSTAYRGDRGAAAYAHTSNTDNPHNVTAEQLGLGDVLEDIEKMPYRLLKYFGTQLSDIRIAAKYDHGGGDAWYEVYGLLSDKVTFTHYFQLPIIWADIDLDDGMVTLEDSEFHFYMQFYDDRVEIHRWRMGEEYPPTGAWQCQIPEQGAESADPNYPSGTHIYKLQFN